MTNVAKLKRAYQDQSDRELQILLSTAKESKKAAENIIANIEDELIARYQNEIKQALEDKPDAAGTANLGFAKFTVPKLVKWDQDMLRDTYEKIRMSNEDPSEYMDIKFSVSETKYKSWPSSIRDQFDPARTVSHGKMKVEFTEE